ncbi:MAG: phosphoserine phosphatase SerB [Actinobacteria bacterium]|uniref:phosphoserine phosphatase n=1 Tax=freshwater metagenome TaxID=449393 RepID=A0A6J7K6R3_9ZZZZ|nr:phosphoserine phosphatase SerB [Actinomycetota bacterium]
MSHQTLLLTLSGLDRPGVTRQLFTAVDKYPVTVEDIEQLVVRGRLVLSVLLSIDAPHEMDAAHGNDASHGNDAPHDEVVLADLRRSVRLVAAELDMELATVAGAREDSAHRRDRINVTVLGSPLRPSAIAKVAQVIADRGGNIDRIRRIASYPVTAVVFESSGADVIELRHALTLAVGTIGADIAVQAAGLDRRGQHLVVMDVDSTVIQEEVIDLLAAEAGVVEQVSAITSRAMAGEIDFTESLLARVALLQGLPESALDTVRSRITLTPGARTLCRTLNNLGYRVCLVSGGFIEVVGPLASDLGVDNVRANTLEITNGFLTGQVIGEIIDRAGKRRALEAFAAEYGIPMRRTIAIGDGANDIDMLEAAALGVAFNGKAAARAAADTSVSVPYLDSVLYLLGITREEIEDADALAGFPTPSPRV